jgi:Uma2 family endonuclease
MALPAEKQRYTFADCLAWDEHERIELIDGKAIPSPPTSTRHQEVLGELAVQLGNFLHGTGIKVYMRPFGVRLFEKEGDRPEDVDTVVEPDISVICDRSKLDERGCKGAPDLIIEILSPSTRRHDRVVKLDLYQRSGVREYWLVNPEDRSVLVMLRDEAGNLRPREDYGAQDTAQVNVLEGCSIDLGEVFAQ